MKKRYTASVMVLAVFACLFFCTPAFACYNWNGYPMQGEEHPLFGNGTVANGTVIGGVYVDAGHGLSGEMPYTQTFSVPAYDEVRFAHLYVHVWGATPAYHGWLNTSFNEHSLGNLTLLGDDDLGPECEKQVWCTSHGVNIVWYNVSNIVVQGDNSATAVTGRLTGNFDGRVGMIELIVVYEKAGMAETLYWIVQGHDALTYPYAGHPAKDYGYSYFNGTINPDDCENAVFYNTWIAGEQVPDNDTLWFNDNMLCEDCAYWDQGAYFDFKAFEVKNASVDYLSSSNNYATYWRAEDEYVHWLNTVLVLSLGTGSEQQPDLIVEDLNAFHYDSGQNVWFNLTNEVNVTVNNIGNADAGAFNVSLYANDTFIAKQSVSSLPRGNPTTLQFLWTPTGCDCDDDCSPVDYTLKAVADCDNNVVESDESNNESTTVETVYWNGYTSDQPLEHIIHGTIRGGLYYTQGDGRYTGLYLPGYNTTATYELTLPDGADVALARLNVYYTWQKGTSKYPDMVVNITNSSGTYVLTLNASYNDSPCTGLAFPFPYGNYVYDVAPYITGNGSYTVEVKNNATTRQSSNFCVAAPGIVILYEDSTKPEYEYWLIEGADLLEGGRRYGAGSLSLEECTSNATFTGDIDTVKVETATLGMVSAWGGGGGGWGDYPSLYWFNDNYLGNDTIMVGYVSLYNRTVDGISMYVGASGNAQIGANVSDVTSYIASSGNTVSFGDDGDLMMPANAFLMVEYKDEEEKPDLIVSTIEPNCGGYLFGNESNEICAEIENVGAAAATLFNVSFEVDGFSEVVALTGLAAGANTSVCVNDTTLRNAGDAVAITVTADCDGDVSESDETNNASTMNTTVVNNGYKGKRYTGGEDITTWKTFELNGNLLYSVGDSYYLSATTYPHWTTYTANWTASDLPLDGASVREARLYVPYTWDKAGVMPDEASLTFNGNVQARAQHYSDDRVVPDSKPYGMLVYNVTADFNSTVNNAVLTNSHPGGGNVSIRGMLLVMISADDREPERKLIINEGFDLLYGGSAKCTTPAEATAYAPLDAIALAGVEKATLITVAPGAGPNEGDLLFNGQTWTDVWNFTGSTQIGIKETNVTAYLNATANEAGFQSNEDWMEAGNAFLVVEYQAEAPTCNVSLLAGWNLISVPLNLSSWVLGNESAVGTPLNVTPKNSLASVYRYNITSGSFDKCDYLDDWGWWPATGSEGFTVLEPGRGYWVWANNECNLGFTGTVPYDLDVTLNENWNLIGWYSLTEALLGNESVVGDPLNVTPENSLSSVYRYNSTTGSFDKCDRLDDWGWWPATGSESFTALEPGRGYWVWAENECVWGHNV